MKRFLATLVVLAPLTAFAAAPAAVGDRKQPDPAKLEKMREHVQTALTIGLANALDLDAQQALQLQAQMKPFEDRRLPLHQVMHDSKEILERAADGDPAALGQVDQAIQKAFDARQQMEQIDRDMVTAISRNMQPQQKAKLAVFLAQFKAEMMGKMAKGHMGGHGRWNRGE